ncbi:MAG: MBL fold metallo-hydrolase [Gemmatimonas sp.]
MKLTTIGTGTGAPHPLRVCAGHLVAAGDVRLLLDCGNGVLHRMATLGADWSSITHLAITHFHADHVADIPMLIFAWRWGQLPPRTEPVTIVGPVGTRSLLERQAAAFGAWVLDPGFPIIVEEIPPDHTVSLSNSPSDTLSLSSFKVPHTAESMAYSIVHNDKRLVYTGDTSFDPRVGEWAAGCDVLLSECSLPDEMAIAEHLTPRQTGALAAIAQPSLLLLTHLYPPLDHVDVRAQVAEQFSGQSVIATDGFSIEL